MKIDLTKIAAQIFLAAIFISCGRPVATSEDGAAIPVEGDPVQSSPNSGAKFTLSRGGAEWTVTPLASYTLRGIAVSCERYYMGWQADVAKYDLAVVWGDFVKDDLYKKVSWSQSGRWYWWTYGADFAHDNTWIARRSSNTHMVAANENIERAIGLVEVEKPVEASGLLVRIDEKPDGSGIWWVSSTSRDDTGDGSCEVLYVTEIRVGGKVYR